MILPLHTFKYWSKDVNMFYTNMKETFETVQSKLSRNHPFGKFWGILSKKFYRILIDEPFWEWRSKCQAKISAWQSWEFRWSKSKS